MRAKWTMLAVLVLFSAAPVLTAAPAETLVNGFESADELKNWEISSAGAKLVTEGVTQGKTALELTFDPEGRWSAAGLNWRNIRKDWSPFDVLVIDVTNPNDKPVRAGCLVGDEAWEAKSTYWNRHNSGEFLAPGKNTWMIPVHGLYRGEAGSRNNDIKTDIDPKRITRLSLSFGARGETGKVIVDNIRFLTSDRPEGVLAFDFGPESQTVMPGWTALSNRASMNALGKFGWVGNVPDGMARSTTFGPMLTQDFIECAGHVFRLDVPAGDYEVFLIWEQAGYWGGEEAKHAHREIQVNAQRAWAEDRPLGPATALYQFEDVEPVGVDIWDTYMAGHLVKPIRFRATAAQRGGLSLRFESDAGFSCHVAALAVYKADDAAAKQWIDAQMNELAREFRAKAVSLDPPAQKFVMPAAWQGKSLIAWPMDIEDELKPTSLPPADAPGPGALKLTAQAVRGEYEPVCIAVRQLPTSSETFKVALEWEGGRSLPAQIEYVRYNTRRGFGNLAYTINTFDMRPVGETAFGADFAREFVVTFKVPQDAAAGVYNARLKFHMGGRSLLEVPVAVTVHDVTLSRETDFLMGFFGLYPMRALVGEEKYEPYLEQTLEQLREHGMNALTRAPQMDLTGWRDGQPVIDFKDCDRIYALYRKHGFTKAIGNYGAYITGLHGRYEVGAEGARVARESGLEYPEALMRVWGAIDKHARANNWPTVFYTLCDETRVRERAEAELPFMKMMSEVSKRYPQTMRTLGSYSVNLNTRPADMDSMLYWHQRFFEALDVSSLNSHDEPVMAEAKRLGKDIHIYNQGRDRYSFGLYQWSEFTKGVKARWQWHLNVLHGYQFFDLDGREPDPAMIVYTSKGIRPTIMFERCREGAEDFYLFQTLQHAIDANVKAARKPAETARAAAVLKAMADAVKLNQRRPPEGYNPAADKAKLIEAIVSIW